MTPEELKEARDRIAMFEAHMIGMIEAHMGKQAATTGESLMEELREELTEILKTYAEQVKTGRDGYSDLDEAINAIIALVEREKEAP